MRSICCVLLLLLFLKEDENIIKTRNPLWMLASLFLFFPTPWNNNNNNNPNRMKFCIRSIIYRTCAPLSTHITHHNFSRQTPPPPLPSHPSPKPHPSFCNAKHMQPTQSQTTPARFAHTRQHLLYYMRAYNLFSALFDPVSSERASERIRREAERSALRTRGE